MAEIKKERTTFNSAVRAKQKDGGITPGITAFEKENKTDFEKRFEEQTEQMVEKAQTMKNAEAQFDDIVSKNKEVERNATGYMSATGKNKPDIVSRWEKQTESMSLQKTKDDYSDYLKNNNGAKVGNINVRKDVEWKNNVVKQTGSASWEDFLSKLNEGDETYIESIDTSEMTEVGKKYVKQMKSAVEARKKLVKSMDEYDGYKESTDFLGGVAELKTTDGKSYGYVSGKAIEAIRGNTLENYRPISDSESEVLSEYERETTGYTVSELKKRIEELEKIPAEKYVYDDENTPELEAVALSRVYSADEIAEIKKNTEKANKKKITDTYSIWDYAFDLVSEPISFLGGSDAYLKNSERIAERKEKSDEEKKKASEREEAVSSAANMAAREKTEKVTLAADWEENSSLTQIEQYAYPLTDGVSTPEGKFIAGKLYSYSSDENKYLDYLTDDEKKVMIYLIKKNRKDEARAYFDAIKGDVLQERSEQRAAETRSFATNHPFWANVGTLVESPLQGLKDARYVAKDKWNEITGNSYGNFDANDERFDYERDREIIAEVTNEKIDNPVGKFMCDVVLSSMENVLRSGSATLAGGLIGGPEGAAIGAKASLALMGTKVYQSGVYDATKRGASKEAAVWYGITSAGVEIMTEKIGIDKLLNVMDDAVVHGSKAIIKNLPKQMAAEGTEEFISGVLEPIYDDMIMGENSHFNIRVRELCDAGMEKDDARKQAFMEECGEILSGTAAGALSGGVLSIGGSIVPTINMKMQGEKIVKNGQVESVIAEGMKQPENTLQYRLAKELDEKTKKNAKLTDVEVGRLDYVNHIDLIEEGDVETENITEDAMEDEENATAPVESENEAENTGAKMTTPGNIETLKKATDIVMERIGNGAWNEEKENAYKNAVKDLETLKKNAESTEYKAAVEECVSKLNDSYVSANYGTVMSIESAIEKSNEKIKALQAQRSGGKQLEAVTDIDEQIRKSITKRADLEQIKKLTKAGFSVKFFASSDSGVNGATIGKDVYVNLDGEKSIKHTIGHEFVHMLKKNNEASYESYVEAVKKTIADETRGELYEKYSERYDEVYPDWSEETFWEEYASDVAGDLAEDVTFGKNLIEAIAKENIGTDVKKNRLRAIEETLRGLITKIRVAWRKKTGQFGIGEAAVYEKNLMEVHRELLKAYSALTVDNASVNDIMESRSGGSGNEISEDAVLFDRNGIRLTKREYAQVTSAISTDYYNKNKKHNGLCWQYCIYNDSDFYYLYYDQGFGEYKFVGRIGGNHGDMVTLLEEGNFYEIAERNSKKDYSGVSKEKYRGRRSDNSFDGIKDGRTVENDVNISGRNDSTGKSNIGEDDGYSLRDDGTENTSIKFSLSGNEKASEAETKGENIFVPDENDEEVFSTQIDEWLKGKMPKRGVFAIGKTPEVLKAIGAKDLTIVMNPSVLAKITGEKHDVSIADIKNIPKLIADPVMIFKSATVNNAVVILTDATDKNGNEIIVAMHFDKKEKRIKVNRVASVYGKNNIKNFVNIQIENGNLKYIDKNKSLSWSHIIGLQLPKMADTTRGFNNSILTKDDFVNREKMSDSVKFSLSENKKASEEETKGENYTYDSLVEKDDMFVTQLTEDVPYTDDGKIDRKAVKQIALENVRKQDNPKNTGTNAYVYVKSIDSDVLIGSTGLDHGLTRKADATAKVTMKIGDILSNAIAVNELEPRKQSSGSYVLLGIGADEEGDYYPTRIVVNQFEVDEVEVLDVLYAVNAKREKKNQSPNGARLPANAVPTIKGSSSTVTVAELLNVVKNFFPDVLSEDVLKKYGIERPKSTLSDSVKFSKGDHSETPVAPPPKKKTKRQAPPYKERNVNYDAEYEDFEKNVAKAREDVKAAETERKNVARAELLNRAYEIERKVEEKLAASLSSALSEETKDAVLVYAISKEIGDERRVAASTQKLVESVIKNEEPRTEVKFEDDVEDDGFLEHLKGVEKVYVSKDARQDVTAGELSRTFGVGRWSGKEGLPVDVLYDEMAESGISLPKADAIQDKLIAIIDKKEEVSNKRRVRLPRDEVRGIVEYALDLSDYKTSGTSEDRVIPNKSGVGRSGIDEDFKTKRRELSEKMEKLGDEDLDEKLRLKSEKEAIEDDFVAGWIKDGKTKNIRDVTMDFCTMEEADEAIARARLKRTSDAAAEAEEYAKENKMTQGMKSVAKEMARGFVTEDEINIKYRNAADRVKIKELSELYKRMSYTKADLKKEQRDTMYEVCDILMRNSEYMRDITSIHGQIDSFENIVDYICRVDSLKDSAWSKEIPEDVRKKLLKDAERLNEVFFNPIQKNTEAMNAWKKRYMEKLSEIGIEKRSSESAAAQALGENFYNKDDLYRAKFSEKQIEKIEELAKFLKEMYKEILPKINEVRFSQGEEDIQNPKFKVNGQLKSIITKMHRDVQFLKHNEKTVKNLSESQIEDYAKRNDLSINAMKAFRAYPIGEFEKHIDWRSEQSTKSMGDMAQWAWNLLESGKAYDRKKGTIEMDYFPHMEKSDAQNEILQLLNLKKTIDKLPTAISGMTEMFRPNKKWSAFMQERLGNETEFDAATGAERYLDSMGKYLYHASDITKIRILENFVREKYSKSGADKFQLSNFAKYLREYGNNLAGKQHIIDRAFQDTFVGRRMAQWYRMVMNNVSRNQLAGNISTAMSNAALYGQGVSWVIREAVYAEDASYLAKIFNTGMGKREEHIAKSTFLSNRFSDDIRLKDRCRFYNSIAFVNEKLFAPAQIVDKVIATRVHQMMTAVYVSQGMSEADAIENADIELRRLVASREYGESPLLFSSKTLGVMTKYTLEPLNQMRYYKNQFGRLTKAVLTGDDDRLKEGLKEATELMVTLAADMLIMHLVNWGFKKVKGYPVVTDPIQMGMDAFDSLKEGDVSGAWLDALDEVPIVSNIMKASQGEVTDLVMIGDLINFVSSLCTMTSSDADWGEIAYHAGMIINPFGGVAQIKKMCQAIVYLKKGYWEKNGNVQYATDSNAWDWTVGILFGKSAIPSVQEYYNNGYEKLSKNNSDAFKTILDLYPIEPEELFDMMTEYQELVKEAKKENETYELHTWITEELDKWKKDDGNWDVYDKYYIWNIMKGRKCDVPERFNEAERKIAEVFIETGDTSVLIDEMSDSFSVSGYGKTTVYQLGEEDVLSLQGEYEKILSSKIMKDYKAIRNSGSMSTERWVECIKNAKKKSLDEAKEAAVANGWYEDKTEEAIENADYFAIMHSDIQEEKMSELEAFYLYLDAKGKDYVMPDWQNATEAQEKLAKIFVSCEEEPEDFLPTNKTNTFNNDKKTYVLNEEQHERLKKLYLDYYWEQIANMPEMPLDDTLAYVKKVRKAASEYAKSCILSEYGDVLVIRK